MATGFSSGCESVWFGIEMERRNSKGVCFDGDIEERVIVERREFSKHVAAVGGGYLILGDEEVYILAGLGHNMS
jgi:hypothetical protein